MIDGILVRGEPLRHAAHERVHLQRLGLALGPVLEPHEQQALVLAAPGEIEAVHLEHRVDHARFVLQQVVADVVEDDAGEPLRRARRRLHLDEHEALVLARQEGRGQSHEEQPDRDDQRGVDREEAPGPARSRSARRARTGRAAARTSG